MEARSTKRCVVGTFLQNLMGGMVGLMDNVEVRTHWHKHKDRWREQMLVLKKGQDVERAVWQSEGYVVRFYSEALGLLVNQPSLLSSTHIKTQPTHTHTHRSYCFPYLNHWHKSSWREETTEWMNDIYPHTVPKQCWDVQLIIMGNLPEHDLLWKMSSCLPLNLNRRCTQQHKSRMKKHSGWSVLKRLPAAPLRDVIVVYLHRKELQNPSPKSAN